MAFFKKSQPKNDLAAKPKEEKSVSTQIGSRNMDSLEKMKIKHPWITEKAGRLIDSENKYVFLIDKKINKIQAAKAIESIYGVEVLSVNIINKKGKVKLLGRSRGKVPGYKKAIATLKEGHKIDVMPT